MAAFVPTSNPRPAVAYADGADDVVLVATGGFTATASQEFVVLQDVISVELGINFVKTGAAPSVVFSIEYADVAATGSGVPVWLTLLTSAAVVATGSLQLLIGNSVPNVANISAAHNIRRLMRVTATHGNTDVATYSISACSNDG